MLLLLLLLLLLLRRKVVTPWDLGWCKAGLNRWGGPSYGSCSHIQCLE